MNNRDFFGKEASSISHKKLFLFDMDGTIYEEDNLFEGVKDLLLKIEENNGRYVFITNNSSKSVDNYINKLENLGISVVSDNFFTSTQVTILMLLKEFSGKTVYCQGTKAFLEELRKSGINVTENADDDIDVIVVGFDTELTSEKIRSTCRALKKDVPFYATNPDLACPVNFGFIPDCGSICMMLENATGRRPIYLGKPEATMINYVCEKYSVPKQQAVVIGDRLYTDIKVGINAGITSVCVLTGEATEDDIVKGDIKPSFTFKEVKEIIRFL